MTTFLVQPAFFLGILHAGSVPPNRTSEDDRSRHYGLDAPSRHPNKAQKETTATDRKKKVGLRTVSKSVNVSTKTFTSPAADRRFARFFG